MQEKVKQPFRRSADLVQVQHHLSRVMRAPADGVDDRERPGFTEGMDAQVFVTRLRAELADHGLRVVCLAQPIDPHESNGSSVAFGTVLRGRTIAPSFMKSAPAGRAQ